MSSACGQVREKNDKFQQQRLDAFFKQGIQEAEPAGAGDEEDEAEDRAVPLAVMAMEVEMEVCCCC